MPSSLPCAYNAKIVAHSVCTVPTGTYPRTCKCKTKAGTRRDDEPFPRMNWLSKYLHHFFFLVYSTYLDSSIVVLLRQLVRCAKTALGYKYTSTPDSPPVTLQSICSRPQIHPLAPPKPILFERQNPTLPPPPLLLLPNCDDDGYDDDWQLDQTDSIHRQQPRTNSFLMIQSVAQRLASPRSIVLAIDDGP